MKYLKDGFLYYQSKKDIQANGNLTESEYDFIDEIKRSCAFYVYKNNKRYILTASYASGDKTAPEYFISDLQWHKREPFPDLETAKETLFNYSTHI